MSYILFHIPHSSLKIPSKYWNICIKDRESIQKTNIFLSDILTDKLVPDKYLYKEQKVLLQLC